MRSIVAAALALTTVTVAAQSPSSFEVASIRENTPVRFIVLDAFNLRDHQLRGRRVDPGCEKPPACTALVNRQSITARTQEIRAITPALQSLTGRPVVDKRELAGTFDVDMKWSTTGDDGPSIFTVLQEQLGLRLEPSKGPFEVVVIDSLARPTPG